MKKSTLSSSLLAALMLVTGSQFVTSCKKGEDDPSISFRSRTARVAGEWTVSEFSDSGKSTSEYEDDPTTDDEVVLFESEYSMSMSNGMLSQTASEIYTYDGDGYYKSEESTFTSSGGEFEEEETQSYTDGTSQIEKREGTYTSSAEWTFTFEKDGTFTSTRTSTQTFVSESNEDAYDLVTTRTETSTDEYSGTWAFIGANDANEFKKNERISLWYESMNSTTETEVENDYTDKDSEDFLDYDDFDSTSETLDTDSETYSDSDADETWAITQLKNKEMMVERSYTQNSNGETEYSYTSGSTTNTNTSTYTNSSSGETSMTLTQE